MLTAKRALFAGFRAYIQTQRPLARGDFQKPLRLAAGVVSQYPFTSSATQMRHRHREFEVDGPFQEELDDLRHEEEEEEYLDGENEEEFVEEHEMTPEELEAEIPYDEYLYSNEGRRLKKDSEAELRANKTRGHGSTRGAHKREEVENNMIYYEGSPTGMERLKDLSAEDMKYVGPDGSLILEKLGESGEDRDEPIIPVREIAYRVPYSVEGYRNRQRVFEGFDPDASNPTSQFTDVKIVKLESGKGGDGKVSFFRDAGRSKGPPDGGDGGEGGSVYIQAVEGETSLHKIRYHYKAEDGKGGSMTQLNGRSGKDLLLQVPVGTVVHWIPDPKETFERWKTHQIEQAYEANKKKNSAKDNDDEEDVDSDVVDGLFQSEEDKKNGVWLNNQLYVKVPVVQEKYDPVPLGIKLNRHVYNDGEGWLFKDKGEAYHFEREYFLALRARVARFDRGARAQEEAEDYFPLDGLDLSKPTPPILLLRGGKGGLGNMHFLTQMIRNPRFAKRGRAGTGGFFLLELKLLADLGLVGLPNAGKSTLLRAISRARPRVGHWEFTTLRPTIGTVGRGIAQPAFTVADIPGIVKGARRENRGMGLDFLRHIERSGGLVFVVSLEEKLKQQQQKQKQKLEEDQSAEEVEAAAAEESLSEYSGDNESSVRDLELLVDEVGERRMRGKKVLVVATKADLEGSEARFRSLVGYCKARGWQVVPCSGMRKENIEPVIRAMGGIITA
ncbi:uncharacterized protein SAPINGB_P003110 [Magnusiomyces paraingens]|uniref:Obg family GTPase CgtA n=1 Tax=Magnusiomyces paraingens TaxID=2606893 RepID=A0A5E8BIT7_9ASCO|nr:uncharacterized protein SAPINGB_P003110 [Saprochaete ingens]VVT51480.1 unnamed protein product [Saprochaete ingens]